MTHFFIRRSVILAIVIACSILLSASSFAADTAATVGPKEKLHVYLLIGQSNMAGRAPVPEDAQGPIDRCFLLNGDDQWQQAQAPLNQFSTIRKGLGMQKLNPGYGFATTMLEADKGIQIGLVVNAKGGSSIREWKKGSRFYDEAIRRTQIAMKSGTLKGILWHQGESDAGDEEYLAKLKQLVTDLRADLGVVDLPFIAGQVHDVPLVNEQIAQLPKELPNTGYASSEELTTMDRWHFDTKSMLILGQRYAEAMQKVAP